MILNVFIVTLPYSSFGSLYKHCNDRLSRDVHHTCHFCLPLMCVCATVQRKEEEERMMKKYHKEIVEEDKMEGNRNDMKHSHYATSSNDGVESSTH